ncbi:MAG: hypothetical protein UR69_C0003G0131 [Candidatus Moranbacteria bacterium GW2011_GWE2_35_2-]|nr:MAG: hypothetical protein UR69_C0003G0131 [Candidatus Moranbacteria bacterium GW2011_GWE2_35_2-]KKQ06151.1 MAG: hypothetical protein US15_C0017G0003 [Candidatus Moranbacteria bacterium GW2011_GWF1_36_4]KKQ21977.1 MAG: hypothetical protein US37_C0005G0019 [Candidatus Moranbacteria bacterium GW2011_GWF2_37_11]KKQ29098.1 MAG: hypothetical protein US44_C0003G0010 [Candidatus Moranbacteria bacterium GW2011_GWD1_37_17]KKQ31083.1 MAG: hypothetical protein US47_C0001G0316 [Candidatus Moranbacteria b
MNIAKITNNKNLIIILSKLSRDFLILFMFSYGMILLAEAILPGIISSHISMTILTWILIATIIISAFLSKKSGQEDISTTPQEENSLTFWLLFVLFLIIIFLSLFGFSLWEIIITTILTIAITFYAKKEII